VTWIEMFMMGWLARTVSLGAYQDSVGMYISLHVNGNIDRS